MNVICFLCLLSILSSLPTERRRVIPPRGKYSLQHRSSSHQHAKNLHMSVGAYAKRIWCNSEVMCISFLISQACCVQTCAKKSGSCVRKGSDYCRCVCVCAMGVCNYGPLFIFTKTLVVVVFTSWLGIAKVWAYVSVVSLLLKGLKLQLAEDYQADTQPADQYETLHESQSINGALPLHHHPAIIPAQHNTAVTAEGHFKPCNL